MRSRLGSSAGCPVRGTGTPTGNRNPHIACSIGVPAGYAGAIVPGLWWPNPHVFAVHADAPGLPLVLRAPRCQMLAMTVNRYTWVTIAEAVRQTGYSDKAIRSRIERGTVLHRKGSRGRILLALESLIGSGPNGEPRDDAGGQPSAGDEPKDIPAARLVDRRSAAELGDVTVPMTVEIVVSVELVVTTRKGLPPRGED